MSAFLHSFPKWWPKRPGFTLFLTKTSGAEMSWLKHEGRNIRWPKRPHTIETTREVARCSTCRLRFVYKSNRTLLFMGNENANMLYQTLSEKSTNLRGNSQRNRGNSHQFFLASRQFSLPRRLC